jgi:antitoxin component of RelBE/YafQ-DinJ toxin-antitoxin module
VEKAEKDSQSSTFMLFSTGIYEIVEDFVMSASKQISAHISEETRVEMEAYVKRYGVKKAYLIEEALQHHLQALREIPEDLIIPSRLVLTTKAIAEAAERTAQKNPPTEALKALFR